MRLHILKIPIGLIFFVTIGLVTGCTDAPDSGVNNKESAANQLLHSDQATETQLRGEDGTEITGDELIDSISDARTNGESLQVDSLGSVTGEDIQTTKTAIDNLEAKLTPIKDSLDSIETSFDGVESGTAVQMASAEWLCPGFVYNGVCVVDYNNTSGSTWAEAVNACTAKKTDLCTVSQYVALREMEYWGDDNSSLFYDNRDVWTADFSDNDTYGTGVYTKSWILRSSNDPTAAQTYGYACCYNVTPEPFRSRREIYRADAATTGGGVMTTKINNSKDTSFAGASTMCSKMGADLCSKSQYVVLNDNDIFDAGFPLWTNEQSDNDSDDFNGVIRATGNNPTWGNLFAYACCASQKLLNNSCSGTEYSGVCTLAIHDPGVGDTNFYDAARACGTLGADVCSKSQMQVLRNMTAFTGESWTNDGADNDNHTVGGLLSSQEDNPIPETELMGYACCL